MTDIYIFFILVTLKMKLHVLGALRKISTKFRQLCFKQADKQTGANILPPPAGGRGLWTANQTVIDSRQSDGHPEVEGAKKFNENGKFDAISRQQT